MSTDGENPGIYGIAGNHIGTSEVENIYSGSGPILGETMEHLWQVGGRLSAVGAD